MEVTLQPNGSLHIRHIPWGLWGVSGLLIVLWLVLMFGVGFASTMDLECRRVEPGQIDCRLTRSILGLNQSTTALPGFQGARLVESRSRRSGNRTTSYQVHLLARTGSVPLTSYSSGSQGQRAFVDRTNRFVADEQAPQLTIQYVDWTGILISLLVLAIGLVLSPINIPTVTWTFDRLNGALTVQKIRLLGRKTTEYRLDHIRKAVVESNRRVSRVVLWLTTGQQVPLTSYASSTGKLAKQEAVRQIQEFLGLDSTSDTSDEALHLFQQGALAYWSNLFGSKATAARLFHQAAKIDPNHQPTWMFLAASAESAEERRSYLERAVAIDPASEIGQRAASELEHLSGTGAAMAIPAGSGQMALLSTGLPAPSISGLESRSITAQLLGVLLFQSSVYRQIADDPTATRAAGAIVLFVAALVGFINGLTSESFAFNGRTLPPGPLHGIAQALIQMCAGMVSWLVGSAVGAFAATTFFRGRTNTAEMLRVLGYSSVFKLLWILPCGLVISWLLSVAGTIIAVREAAEFDTGKAVATAAIAWAIAFAVSGLVWLILTFIAVAVAGSAF